MQFGVIELTAIGASERGAELESISKGKNNLFQAISQATLETFLTKIHAIIFGTL